jgi:hypothetical protein
MMFFIISIIVIVVMAHSFALRKPLADRVFKVCGSICLLISFACLAYLVRLAHGHHIADNVFGVVCFIWIVVCVVTAYALCESWRRLCVYCDNENAKNLLVLIGTLAVAVLGIVACMRLLQWILA